MAVVIGNLEPNAVSTAILNASVAASVYCPRSPGKTTTTAGNECTSVGDHDGDKEGEFVGDADVGVEVGLPVGIRVVVVVAVVVAEVVAEVDISTPMTASSFESRACRNLHPVVSRGII